MLHTFCKKHRVDDLRCPCYYTVRNREVAMTRKGQIVVRRSATETEFQRTVIRLYEGWGYLVGHNYDSRLEKLSGIADLHCYHRQTKAIVILELKKDGENPTENQVFYLSCYNEAGIYAQVARPADLQSGLLEAVARHYATHQGGFDDCTLCTVNTGSNRSGASGAARY